MPIDTKKAQEITDGFLGATARGSDEQRRKKKKDEEERLIKMKALAKLAGKTSY